MDWRDQSIDCRDKLDTLASNSLLVGLERQLRDCRAQSMDWKDNLIGNGGTGGI